MNYYYCSDGTKVSKAYIDRKVREAKSKKIMQFLNEHGYIVCEDCWLNDCLPVDCSHDISVKECQETGRSELAWDVNNITLRGRRCHQKHDKLNLKFHNKY